MADFDAILFESMEAASFDGLAWVNRLLEASSADLGDEEALLNSVRTASTRLQARSQELSRDAERLMERMLSVGPRAVQELDRVERDAMALKQDLKRLQDESKSSSTSASPFQTLKSLDLIKTNLEKCIKVLEETENWNSLVREMEAHFVSRNLGEVAFKLSIMRDTLKTLENLPDASKRSDIMERMEQRLEALVRPGLQSALEQLNEGSTEAFKQSVTVFERLGRKQALLVELGESRGRACFEACWSKLDGSESNRKYDAFLDRALAHLREVESPICVQCFSTSESASEAIAHIIKSFFERISAEELVKHIVQSTVENKRIDAQGCERFVLAFAAAKRFQRDISASLLSAMHSTSPGPNGEKDMKERALAAVLKPFAELDSKYLEWETSALLEQLKNEFSSDQIPDKTAVNDALDDILGPSGWEQRLSRLNLEDVLERLTSESASRCAQLNKRAIVPTSKLFVAYSVECLAVVQEPSNERDTRGELELLKLCSRAKQRFESVLRSLRSRPIVVPSGNLPEMNGSDSPRPQALGFSGVSPATKVSLNAIPYVETEEEEVALMEAMDSLGRLIRDAQARLYSVLITPALVLLDKIVSIEAAGGRNQAPSAMTNPSGPSDDVTKIVDFLYSLIPLLDFENVSSGHDLVAHAPVLVANERNALEALINGMRLPFGGSAHNIVDGEGGVGEDDDMARIISTSWLETIARGLSTGFTLRVARLKKLSDKPAAQLGMDADYLEKNIGSVLSQGTLWDPALGVARVVLTAGPGLTHLRLGNPAQHLDERYHLPIEVGEALRELEHVLATLRTRS